MKKFLVIMLAVVMLATFVGCQCGTGKEKKAEFQEKSYVYQDADGNEYEVTIKISPWILKSKNPELINEVWAEVGQGERLPETPEDWGIFLHEDGKCWSSLGIGLKKIPGYFRCFDSEFDMYYVLGSAKIKFIKESDQGIGLNDINIYSELFFDGDVGDPDNYTAPMCCRAFCGNGVELINGVPCTNFEAAASSLIEIESIQRGGDGFNEGDSVEVPFIIMHGEATLPGKTKPYYFKKMVDKELTIFNCDDRDLILRCAMDKDERVHVKDYDSRVTFILDIID